MRDIHNLQAVHQYLDTKQMASVDTEGKSPLIRPASNHQQVFNSALAKRRGGGEEEETEL